MLTLIVVPSFPSPERSGWPGQPPVVDTANDTVGAAGSLEDALKMS
jgi:hypothetical protein